MRINYWKSRIWTLLFSVLAAAAAALSCPTSILAAAGEPPGWAQAEDGGWRYLLPDGSPVRGGWMKEGDGWYYFDGNGLMAAGASLEIEGHAYRFEAGGAWVEDPATDPLFVRLPSGRLTAEQGGLFYEHPFAGIRIPLPENAAAKTAGELRTLSAYDYIPSYYDFLAVIPDTAILGVVIQYNSDPLEKILEDDHQVFSNFRGRYDLEPSAPQAATIAGYPCTRISCSLPAELSMDVYLRCADNKALYLFIITPRDRQAEAESLAASVCRPPS